MEGPLGVITKVWGEETGGVLSIVEHPVDPGVLVMPHTHRDFDEWSYVLEGVVGARIGDEVIEAQPGSWVLKPRGIPHTFWNAGPKPARFIELITPAGFERFFERVGKLMASGTFTLDYLDQLGAEYGTAYFSDWVPDLEKTHGLKLLGSSDDRQER
jgi:quercetin dioxygenase-like cupin family protein